MDRERNILLAKKYMVESIYRSANIEGIGMTFPETQTICDGMSVSGHTLDEINAVNDLKNAWRWIFQNINTDIDVEVLCQLNRIAGKYTVINAGTIRSIYDEPIRVPLYGGKNYYPSIPDSKEEIDSEIKQVTGDKTLDNALELFCLICKRQIFNDGNKRTATLITNMYMIQNGLGIMSIPVDKKLDFYNALTDYYDSDAKKENLIIFLKNDCLTGN
ncbi:MAG: Fic family protein [Lachnospiraceae bacterium]|nr:Fic family protein [Lachnospiraceae bacterium]